MELDINVEIENDVHITELQEELLRTRFQLETDYFLLFYFIRNHSFANDSH